MSLVISMLAPLFAMLWLLLRSIDFSDVGESVNREK